VQLSSIPFISSSTVAPSLEVLFHCLNGVRSCLPCLLTIDRSLVQEVKRSLTKDEIEEWAEARLTEVVGQVERRRDTNAVIGLLRTELGLGDAYDSSVPGLRKSSTR
jgi:hypothetical protein